MTVRVTKDTERGLQCSLISHKGMSRKTLRYGSCHASKELAEVQESGAVVNPIAVTITQ